MKNKTIFFTVAIMIIAMSSIAQITGTFTDSRDGKIYKTVKIGTQTWMAENLAYRTDNGCWAPDGDTTKIAVYGYLYNWKTAKTACPKTDGWYLPTDVEWKKLTDNSGGIDSACKLKSTTNWQNDQPGTTNNSGFTALPGGYRAGNDGAYSDLGYVGYWWTSTANDAATAWNWYLGSHYTFITRDSFNKEDGYSVRCVKN